ncbi:hypothetical protein AYJ57_02085 [Salipiger sp. CCB-MM3]|uniref:hypothetical protein n=1 Tax=Salipiger sp. CCB-MM3 TaxID=1792508 RepID=UPI00080A9608|nr:hypothetical protein [Salipiger sp. CCB-MM3]ANT59255.1 hypothetical protein AYJ57_02085 [Salipiger sp. CCB-MM3]
MARPYRVYFVYTRRKRDTGSTVMRAFQLREMLAQHASARIEAGLIEMPERADGFAAQERWVLSLPRDAVYVISKTAVRKLSSRAAHLLRWWGRGLCFDHVDEPQDRMRFAGADLHLSCSFTQQDAISARPELAGRVRLVHHHVDPEIYRLPQAQQAQFAALYLGDPLNTEVPPEIAAEVTQLPASTRAEFEAALPRLPEYNLHFCARRFRAGQEGAFKPFLKGFTAAALGAAVLASRDTEDAERFLGADYPFFFDCGEAPAVLERARDAFGGPVWTEARARMAAMAEMVRPEAIANQLANVVEEFY